MKYAAIICSAFIFSNTSCIPKNNDSNVKIVGGSRTTGYPEVKMILVDKMGPGVCTGVVVSDSTMLIAGHCIKSSTVTHNIPAPDQYVDAKDVHMWYRLINKDLLTEQDAAHDLAVIVYPDGTFKQPFAKVTQASSLASNQEVDIVGFGATTFGKALEVSPSGALGEKNFGSNVINKASEGVITIEAELNSAHMPKDGRAVAASGDSGSPMFLKGTHEVVGISSAIGAFDARDNILPLVSLTKDINIRAASKVRNLYVDLTHPISRRLLQIAVARGARIDGIHPASDTGLTREDSEWMKVPESGDIGDGSYKGIFFFSLPSFLTKSIMPFGLGVITTYPSLRPTPLSKPTRLTPQRPVPVRPASVTQLATNISNSRSNAVDSNAFDTGYHDLLRATSQTTANSLGKPSTQSQEYDKLIAQAQAQGKSISYINGMKQAKANAEWTDAYLAEKQGTMKDNFLELNANQKSGWAAAQEKKYLEQNPGSDFSAFSKMSQADRDRLVADSAKSAADSVMASGSKLSSTQVDAIAAKAANSAADDDINAVAKRAADEVLAQNPQLNAEQIQAIAKQSADDVMGKSAAANASASSASTPQPSDPIVENAVKNALTQTYIEEQGRKAGEQAVNDAAVNHAVDRSLTQYEIDYAAQNAVEQTMVDSSVNQSSQTADVSTIE